MRSATRFVALAGLVPALIVSIWMGPLHASADDADPSASPSATAEAVGDEDGLDPATQGSATATESAGDDQDVAFDEARPEGEVTLLDEGAAASRIAPMAASVSSEEVAAAAQRSAATATAAVPASVPVPVFNKGFIITDREFYRKTAMTQAEIRIFIQDWGKRCKSVTGVEGAEDKICLKDLKIPAATLTSDQGGNGCSALTIAEGTAPWAAVYRVANACNISPKVLLSTIQKESSGIEQPKTQAQWDKMMGMGCPDNAGCNPKYAGFANQLYFGADRLRAYRTWTTYPFIKAYLNQTPVKVDGETFLIESMATASLYTYTPHVDGNRLFHSVMKRYFPEALSLDPFISAGARWAGANRIGTAIEISANAWTAATAKKVYIARSDITADAQVAGTLTGGPILLSSSTSVSAAVQTEIARLGNPEVVVIGSTDAISDKVAKAYAGARGFTRLGGKDRVRTAIEVSTYAFPSGSKPKSVYLTDGFGSDPKLGGPDGVVGGVLTDGPVLLVNTKNGASAATKAEIARLSGLGAKDVFALGGNPVGHPVKESIGGKTRYDTALLIAERAFPSEIRSLYLANGALFVDAVAAGTVTDGPILLVNEYGPTADVCSYIHRASPDRIVALGGENAVTEQALSAALICSASGGV